MNQMAENQQVIQYLDKDWCTYPDRLHEENS